MTQAMFDYLVELASKERYSDDKWYSPGEMGNFGDAYDEGLDDGEIRLARELLQKFGKENDKQSIDREGLPY